MIMSTEYELIGFTAEETDLFYTPDAPGYDEGLGCLGRLRGDFGRSGNTFFSTWADHSANLKTKPFSEELDNIINTLRNGVLKDLSTMAAHCRANPQAKLDDGRDYSYGFKVKTDTHVYYLRFCTPQNVYNIYCHAYNRGILEERFPALADTVMTDELRSKLEKAAAFIIEKSANATESGNYIIGADDIPADILSPELFQQHIAVIAEMMQEYEAIADVGITANGEIDMIIYSDYCPNYEPLPEEQGDFSSDRKILDPLKSKRVPEPEKPIPSTPAPKPTLAERLVKNKEKAAAQGKSTVPKPKKQEELT